MREILFRGKNIYGGQWVEGSLLTFPSGRTKILKKKNRGKAKIFKWNDADLEFDGITVDDKTVGQYTGLTDKNGRKIFEGDIVDCWSEGVNAQGTVQQRRDGLWIIYPAWQKHIMWGLCPDEYSNTTVEVIGNIYDNPELINI